MQPNYRDSTVYKTRYTSLLERALNLVQTAFSASIREISDDVAKQLRSKDQSETAEYILLYGKYETIISNLGFPVERLLTTSKFAFGQTEDNQDRSPYIEQYHDLYKQITDAYLKSRDPVGALVSKNLKKFATTEPKPEVDFESFARRCVQYVLDICHSEQNLIDKFFHDGPLLAEYPSSASWNYAERLDDNILSYLATLHTFLLPFLSNGDLQRICGLVNWLETMYMTSADGDSESEAPREDRKLTAQALLSNYLWKSLDTLFLKAATEIEHFKPSPNDLKFTGKSTAPLAGSKSNPALAEDEKIQGNDTHSSTASTAFPTVQTAVKLLVMYNDGVYDRPVCPQSFLDYCLILMLTHE